LAIRMSINELYESIQIQDRLKAKEIIDQFFDWDRMGIFDQEITNEERQLMEIAIEKILCSLQAWQMETEEREAAVCPEDVGFDEYIKLLRAENERLQDRIEELTTRKRPITLKKRF